MHRAIATMGLLVATTASAGPPGDYGDAPVGDTTQNIQAYSGVLARWDTFFDHPNTVSNPMHPQGAWLNVAGANCWLGDIPPATKFDSAMDPASPENDSAPQILIWSTPSNPGINPLATVDVTVTTGPGHNLSDPVYLNMWIDQNRDGQWKDGYYLGTSLAAWNLEWALQDIPIILPAGTTARVSLSPIRLENPTAPVWVRVMITDEKIGAAFRGPAGQISWWWDSTMNAAHPFHGEIEDVYLTLQTATFGTGPVAGIWYRSQFANPGGFGGGLPSKPECPLQFAGPGVVPVPWCGPPRRFKVEYRGGNDVANGCSMTHALWAMYGYQLLEGAGHEPTMHIDTWPAGGIASNSYTCPQPPNPPPILDTPLTVNFPPALDRKLGGVEATPNAFTAGGNAGLWLNVCYDDPPRFRNYRVYHVMRTCGCFMDNRAVAEYPETGITLASAVVDGPGSSADHTDLAAGGDLEAFLDLEHGRPFPDPDFANYAFNLHSGGSLAHLNSGSFHSAPTSLHLFDAGYFARPAFPAGREASMVQVWHMGSATMVLSRLDGAPLLATLPPSVDWELFALNIPAGFRLDSVLVETSGSADIDDVFVDFRPLTLPCPADADGNSVIEPVDVAVFINRWFTSLQQGTLAGDFDGNGAVTPSDVAVFVGAWFNALTNGC